jgi:hypothetical protein
MMHLHIGSNCSYFFKGYYPISHSHAKMFYNIHEMLNFSFSLRVWGCMGQMPSYSFIECKGKVKVIRRLSNFTGAGRHQVPFCALF